MKSSGSDVIIVVSTPRSGSTWLSVLLESHPALDVYTHHAGSNYLFYLLNPLKSLNPFGDDYIDIDWRAERAMDRLKVRLLKRLFRAKADSRKLVIATPTVAAFLPLFMRSFPGARYVHLRRDPLDRIASFQSFMLRNAETSSAQLFRTNLKRGYAAAMAGLLKHWFHTLRWARVSHPGFLGTRPAGLQKAAKLPPLQFLCWYLTQYEREVHVALNQVPEESKHVITYEGLVSDFRKEMTGLLEFMRVDVPEDFIKKYSEAVRLQHVGRHRKQFDDKDVSSLVRHLDRYRDDALQLCR